jgi:hypothetical protein
MIYSRSQTHAHMWITGSTGASTFEREHFRLKTVEQPVKEQEMEKLYMTSMTVEKGQESIKLFQLVIIVGQNSECKLNFTVEK